MKQRKKQPERTRRTILEATGAEFSRHGYSGSGLGAIVTRSELTKGALFHHFTDKRALALGWIEELLAPERSEEHTSEFQSRSDLVCRLLLEKKKENTNKHKNIKR